MRTESGWRALLRSQATRTAILTFFIGAIGIGILLIFVSALIRDDVLGQRRIAIMEDAHARVEYVEQRIGNLGDLEEEGVTSLLQQLSAQIDQPYSGVDDVRVAFLRSPNQRGVANTRDFSTPAALTGLIPEELQADIANGTDGGQSWRTITYPNSEGQQTAGMVVGEAVTIPGAGVYNLYLFYPLQAEYDLIGLTTRAITVVAIAFLLLLVVLLWAFSWRLYKPIRQTAQATRRLAEGHLDERIPVDRNTDADVAVLAHSFNDLADALQVQTDDWVRLADLQRSFVSDVSHELRTPLTTIALAVEQLEDYREELGDPFAQRSLDMVQTQTTRLSSLFEDLLTISRVDSGRVELSVVEQDLGALVLDVLEKADAEILRLGADVQLELPEDGSSIAEMDAVRIERIIRNFLYNALEHAEGLPIDITVGSDSESVAVRVRDHGVGMTPDVVSRVFDRFYRADPSRKRTLGGTGLGLSIASEDAALHGGVLEAWGWPGDGASFVLTLPRHLGPDGTPGTLTTRPLSVIPDDAPRVARRYRRGPGPSGM